MRRKPFVVVLSVLALSSVACSTVDAEGYVWEEYERNREEILRLSALLAEKHEDTAEARSRWDATRERLNVLEGRQWWRPFGPSILVQCLIAVFAFALMLSINVPLAIVAMLSMPIIAGLGVSMART